MYWLVVDLIRSCWIRFLSQLQSGNNGIEKKKVKTTFDAVTMVLFRPVQ